MKSQILNTKNAKGGNMDNDQPSENLNTAIKSMEAALDAIKCRLDAGECLDSETAANLNALRGASAKLRDVYIVHACATGMKQCKVAEILGLSAGRIVQILAEQSA